jgi:hypothetical protein
LTYIFFEYNPKPKINTKKESEMTKKAYKKESDLKILKNKIKTKGIIRSSDVNRLIADGMKKQDIDKFIKDNNISSNTQTAYLMELSTS